MFKKKSILVGFSAMILTAALSAAARADLVVGLSDTSPASNPTFLSASGVAGTLAVGTAGSSQFGDFRIDSITSADTSSTPAVAFLNSTTVALENTGLLPQTLTITITDGGTAATNFTMPAGAILQLFSSLALSTPLGTGAVASLTSSLTSTPTTTSAPAVAFSGPILTGSGSSSVAAPNPAGNFSLKQVVTLTLPAGATGSLTLTTLVSVPEPSRVAAILGMVGMMGLGLFWQRRRTAAVNV